MGAGDTQFFNGGIEPILLKNSVFWRSEKFADNTASPLNFGEEVGQTSLRPFVMRNPTYQNGFDCDIKVKATLAEKPEIGVSEFFNKISPLLLSRIVSRLLTNHLDSQLPCLRSQAIAGKLIKPFLQIHS